MVDNSVSTHLPAGRQAETDTGTKFATATVSGYRIQDKLIPQYEI